MKSVITLLLIVTVNLADCQNTEYLDLRDSSIYRTININGTLWMTDNMNLYTVLSKEPTRTQKEKHNLLDTEGRYYHFQELDSICPKGWRLPKWEDWKSYLNYLLVDNDTLQLTMETVDSPNHHHVIEGFFGIIDLFEKGNPLNLNPVGRFQGQVLSTNPDTPFADFWTLDENEQFLGRSHAHLWEVLNIHSHEHHMNPNKEDEIRRFMCRCLKEK